MLLYSSWVGAYEAGRLGTARGGSLAGRSATGDQHLATYVCGRLTRVASASLMLRTLYRSSSFAVLSAWRCPPAAPSIVTAGCSGRTVLEHCDLHNDC